MDQNQLRGDDTDPNQNLVLGELKTVKHGPVQIPGLNDEEIYRKSPSVLAYEDKKFERFCSILCTFLLITLNLVLNTVLIVILLYVTRYPKSNQTFGWRKTLTLLGIGITEIKEKCESSVLEVKVEGTHNCLRNETFENCDYEIEGLDFMIPSFLLFLSFLTLLFYTILLYSKKVGYGFGGAFCLGFTKFLTLFLGKLTFTLDLIIMVVLLFAYDGCDENLREFMNSEPRAFSLDYISELWEKTQLNGHCCGIDNYHFWEIGNPVEVYPKSCCDSKHYCSAGYASMQEVWLEGCFQNELSIVKLHATKFIGFFALKLCCEFFLLLSISAISSNESCESVKAKIIFGNYFITIMGDFELVRSSTFRKIQVHVNHPNPQQDNIYHKKECRYNTSLVLETKGKKRGKVHIKTIGTDRDIAVNHITFEKNTNSLYTISF